MQRKYFQAVFFDKVLFFIYSYFSSMTRNGDGRNRPSPFLSMDMMVAKNHLSASFFSSVRSSSALPDDGRYAVSRVVPIIARPGRLRCGVVNRRGSEWCIIKTNRYFRPICRIAAVIDGYQRTAIHERLNSNKRHTIRNCNTFKCTAVIECMIFDTRYTIGDFDTLQRTTITERIFSDTCHTIGDFDALQ